MKIQDWSDRISEEDFAAFQAQFQAGVQSIDLKDNVTKFLVTNAEILEFGLTNDAEHLECKAIIAVPYVHGDGTSLEMLDIDIVGIKAVLVSSVAYTSTNENEELMQTYHLTKRIIPATEHQTGVQDVAWMLGSALGDMYYFVDEQQ